MRPEKNSSGRPEEDDEIVALCKLTITKWNLAYENQI
jgi:hypothetical protein